jgi:hypothetical protein
MGWFVSYWCSQIGVTDPMAQSIAAGIVVATLLIGFASAVLVTVLYILTVILAKP